MVPFLLSHPFDRVKDIVSGAPDPPIVYSCTPAEEDLRVRVDSGLPPLLYRKDQDCPNQLEFLGPPFIAIFSLF